jgi:hypothetical protein
MPIKKGEKLWQRRKHHRGGRPTKEQAAEKESFRQALERKREAKAGILADKYYEMALNDPATMRHLISQVIPPIETHVLSGEIGVRPWTVDVDPRLKKKK